MPTGPYQKIFRKLPKPQRAKPPESSDVHDESTMPLTTDLRTLELFAEALRAFVDSGAEKTVVDARRYKRSTLGLSLVLAALLSSNVVFAVRDLSPSHEEPIVATEPIAAPVPVPTPEPTPTNDTAVVELRAHTRAIARLQIEQSNYVNEVLVALSTRRKVPPKPTALLDAEQDVRVVSR